GDAPGAGPHPAEATGRGAGLSAKGGRLAAASHDAGSRRVPGWALRDPPAGGAGSHRREAARPAAGPPDQPRTAHAGRQGREGAARRRAGSRTRQDVEKEKTERRRSTAALQTRQRKTEKIQSGLAAALHSPKEPSRCDTADRSPCSFSWSGF